jgi:type I restriction enzyme S subunit
MSFHWELIKSEWILSDVSQRLDASFYSRDIGEARILLNKLRKNNVRITTINDPSFTSQVFWPERFKRKYTKENEGIPFLMPKEIFQFFLQPRKFIANVSNNLFAKEKWILITRSGSIGRCLLSNKILSNFALSDDLIRIIPTSEKEVGYIYAFLNTWIGQAYLTKTQYGETIKHIEPKHVGTIPLPLLQESDIKEINEKILKAHKLREEAQELLLKAEKLFYDELNLPILSEKDVKYFGGNSGKIIKAFICKSGDLNLRLDARCHMPIIRKLIETMRVNSNGYLSDLKEITCNIFIPTRFKRIYIKRPEEGIPFLQGSHVPLIKLFDLKYLWKRTEGVKETLVARDWVLLTRSGTVGKTALVTSSIEGWGASEHILRIIAKPDIHPGYLLMFLSSTYGNLQVLGKIYGGVVSEIAEKDISLLEKIKVLIPHEEKVQKKIGDQVREAYEKKDQANVLEEETVKLLERKLEEAAK